MDRGTVFGQEKPAGFTKQKAIEWAVLGTSFLVTIWAAWYIYAKMAKVRPIIVAEIECVDRSIISLKLTQSAGRSKLQLKLLLMAHYPM